MDEPGGCTKAKDVPNVEDLWRRLPDLVQSSKTTRQEEASAMRRFLARHADKITGVLEGFDRIVFRGWLRPFLHATGMRAFLAQQGVLLKDFEVFAKSMTTLLRDASDEAGAKLHEKVHYLTSASVSKEMVARNYLAHRRAHPGPICVLSALEPCWTWQVFRCRDRSQPQEFRRKDAKCPARRPACAWPPSMERSRLPIAGSGCQR